MSNKVISVHYNLHKETAEGEMIETTKGKEPLVFLSGMGQMIPDFEANVVNLDKGDSFSFGITADNAYGKRNDDAIIDLEKSMFMEGEKLADGIAEDQIVPLQDQNGRVVPAKVVSINDTTLTMDVNHPLADQDLHFTGEVVEIREATQEELAQAQGQAPGAQ